MKEVAGGRNDGNGHLVGEKPPKIASLTKT